MPIDPQLAPLLTAAEQAGGPKMSDLDPPAARELANAGVIAPAEPVPVARVEDRNIPGPDQDIPVRIYTPEGEGPFGVLVYYHGSGFVIFDLDSHDGVCRSLCRRAGVVVVSVDYRLAPENKFPAAVLDAVTALRWAQQHAAELGGDPNRMAVGGDSAGGNLAAVVAHLARDRGDPLAFQLLVYPVTDCRAGHPSMDENAEGYLLTKEQMLWFIGHYVRDEADKLDWRASPLLAEDFGGLAPTLVQTCEFDPLRDEGEDYARKLEAAGVPVTLTRYDGLVHGVFQMEGVIDGAGRMLDEAGEALRKALA